MLSFLFVTLVLSVFEKCSGDEGSNSLLTGWTKNVATSGIQWDIKAGNSDVVISSIDFNFNGCSWPYDGDSFELYTKAGSHVGFEELSDTWTYVCGGKVSCDPHLNPSSNTGDAGNCNVGIKAGNTQAFYLQGVSRDLLALEYSGSDNVGDLLASDSNIYVYIGTGMFGSWNAYTGSFRETVRIYYSLGDSVDLQNSNDFYCDNLCKIDVDYYNDEYCDCSNCEDEDFFTCQNCEADRDCDYVAQSCGNWIECKSHWYSKNNADNDDDNSDDDTKSLSYGQGDHEHGSAYDDYVNNNNNNDNDDAGSSVDTGLIIGLVCGGIGLLLIISIGIYFQNKNKKINNQIGNLLSDQDNYAPPNINVLTTATQQE